AERGAGGSGRCVARRGVALLAPVIKGLLTASGFDATNLGLQVFGGHGYIREDGMEQYVRDARIGQLYEGTNGVQAMDLVGRKLLETRGKLFARYAEEVRHTLDSAANEPRLADLSSALRAAFDLLQQSTRIIAERAAQNLDEAGAAATDYLHLFGLVALGDMWLRMAKVAVDRLDTGAETPAFYEAKLATARFYFSRVLPRANAHRAAIEAGA